MITQDNLQNVENCKKILEMMQNYFRNHPDTNKTSLSVKRQQNNNLRSQDSLCLRVTTHWGNLKKTRNPKRDALIRQCVHQSPKRSSGCYNSCTTDIWVENSIRNEVSNSKTEIDNNNNVTSSWMSLEGNHWETKTMILHI